MSYYDFQRVIDNDYSDKHVNFHRDILPQIKRLVADSFESVFSLIDPKGHHSSFELFGFDFMMDENFKVYIIEINTNPCLSTPCPLLTRIISSVIDQTFRITIDPIFEPGENAKKSPDLNKLNWELVYDSNYNDK